MDFLILRMVVYPLTLFVATKAVDNVGGLVAVAYLVVQLNVVKIQSLTVVLSVKQLQTQHVFYQVTSAKLIFNMSKSKVILCL